MHNSGMTCDSGDFYVARISPCLKVSFFKSKCMQCISILTKYDVWRSDVIREHQIKLDKKS